MTVVDPLCKPSPGTLRKHLISEVQFLPGESLETGDMVFVALVLAQVGVFS